MRVLLARIDHNIPPILERLGIDTEHWIYNTRHFESQFKGLVGTAISIRATFQKFSYQRTLGLGLAELLTQVLTRQKTLHGATCGFSVVENADICQIFPFRQPTSNFMQPASRLPEKTVEFFLPLIMVAVLLAGMVLLAGRLIRATFQQFGYQRTPRLGLAELLT